MGLTLVTRDDCELCEVMQAELSALSGALALPPVRLVDVDSDPELQRRYGLKVPVLLLDGELVCYGRLQADELRRLLVKRVPS
jgi:predicted thioredoxin/glutaredoxin